MNIFFIILLIVAIAISCGLLWVLIDNTSKYIIAVTSDRIANTENTRIISIGDRIKNTEDMFPIIRTIINNEITDIIKVEIKTNQKIRYENVDVMLEKIATNVHGSLSQDLLSDMGCILNTDYINKFIINESLNMLLNRIEEHNRNISLL